MQDKASRNHGCLFAARLALAGGHDVRLLDHDSQRAALLNEQGLLFEEAGATHRLMIPVTSDPAGIADVELLLLCVKSYGVFAALATLRDQWPAGALLLAFQNGIAHLDPLVALPASCRRGRSGGSGGMVLTVLALAAVRG